VNLRVRRNAERLQGALSADALAQLAVDPIAAVASHLRLRAVAVGPTTEECSCDGAYLPEYGAICYVPTPNSRRENFTVLHEFGHHLVRSDDDLLSELADLDRDGGLVAEERICDAFAGSVLIPDASVQTVLSGGRPRASHLRLLYDATVGSLEACAVRLAERIGCDGYVALMDPTTRRIRFASASPQCEHAWGRGTLLPHGHAAWKAVNGAYQGQGDIVWSSGKRRRMWLDAVGSSRLVVAVFSDDPYFGSSPTGLTVLDDPGITRDTGVLLSGTCRHCGGPAWGTKACDKCGDPTCKHCGRCGCGAPAPSMRTCPKCHLTKPRALFPRGSAECRDCVQP
jgi:hypothetical protein